MAISYMQRVFTTTRAIYPHIIIVLAPRFLLSIKTT